VLKEMLPVIIYVRVVRIFMCGWVLGLGWGWATKIVFWAVGEINMYKYIKL